MKPALRSPIRRARLAAHYESLLSEHAASGLSMRQFAAQCGVSAWTLYQWNRRLAVGRPTARSQASRLLAVDVVGVHGAAGRASTYELSLADGICLRVPHDFDAARVAELLALVR
jgi:hypothetical protein